MILQALSRLYEQLADKGKLGRPGWQEIKVSYGLQLNEDGGLAAVIPLKAQVQAGKKTVEVPQVMRLPEQVKRSSGVAANFLCDNASYILGIDSKGKPERAVKCFEACAALHGEILAGAACAEAQVLLNFFANWKPELAGEHPALMDLPKDFASANLVFILPQACYAQDVAEIKQCWQAHYSRSDEQATAMRCLVTGDTAVPARLHPAIKGVQGAQATGASLVSFNAPAFDSYGHDGQQGLNAPVGEYAAFAYGAALNYLIADREHMMRLGDMTVVLWAEDAEEAYVDAMMAAFGSKDTLSDVDLLGIMSRLANGETVKWNDVPLNPANRFYVLGLAPNAARLSVRLFLPNTFGALARHHVEHMRRLEIVRPAFDPWETLPLWKLLDETVNPNSRDKKPAPQMAGDVMRSVLTGGRYPATLYDQTQLRIRAESKVTRGRAGIIKAYLMRNMPQDKAEDYREVLGVTLNENTAYAPYVLGRLFSVLEQLQVKANPTINATIRDRYFNAACCTPAIVFPQLIRLAQAHLKKLDGGLSVHFNRQITQLEGMLNEEMPRRLNLYDQGVFQLGYYHQTQKHFEKKEGQDNA